MQPDLQGYQAALYGLLQTEFALHNGDTEAAAYFLDSVRPTLPPSLEGRHTNLSEQLRQMQARPSSQQLVRAFAEIREMTFCQSDQARFARRVICLAKFSPFSINGG